MKIEMGMHPEHVLILPHLSLNDGARSCGLSCGWLIFSIHFVFAK